MKYIALYNTGKKKIHVWLQVSPVVSWREISVHFSHNEWSLEAIHAHMCCPKHSAWVWVSLARRISVSQSVGWGRGGECSNEELQHDGGQSKVRLKLYTRSSVLQGQRPVAWSLQKAWINILYIGWMKMSANSHQLLRIPVLHTYFENLKWGY